MAHITEIGPKFYFQKLYYLDPPEGGRRRHPLASTSFTTETEHPFRMGRCLVLRVPFTRIALACGVWVDHAEDEEEALLTAMQAWVLMDNGIRLTEEVDW